MIDAMPELAGGEKRVVFIHEDGLHQIHGVETEFPITVPPFDTMGRHIEFASLIKVTSRAAYYKAPCEPQSYGSMHKDQR